VVARIPLARLMINLEFSVRCRSEEPPRARPVTPPRRSRLPSPSCPDDILYHHDGRDEMDRDIGRMTSMTDGNGTRCTRNKQTKAWVVRDGYTDSFDGSCRSFGSRKSSQCCLTDLLTRLLFATIFHPFYRFCSCPLSGYSST
jgi:hypothetical protein